MAKKGKQWHQGTKAGIGVEAKPGIVYPALSTTVRREEAQGPERHTAMQLSKRKQPSDSPLGQRLVKVEGIKASFGAKVERMVPVLKSLHRHRKT